MKMIHMQGDISLIPHEAVKGEVIKHNGEFVLAYGETSGHAHRVKVANPEQMVVIKDKDGNVYLKFTREGKLTHEEHETHVITPGWYKLNHEREHDYFSNNTRRVQD